MVSLLKHIVLLYACISYTIADVSISKPLLNQNFAVSGGSANIDVSWIESNAPPKLVDITEYTFVLCSGPNTDVDAVKTLKKLKASDINNFEVNLDIDASIGASGLYYIQIYATSDNGFSIHYTNRFNLTGMTGTYKPTVGIVTTPPEAQTSLSDGSQTLLKIDSKSFTVPYTEQTGVARFAPMQTQPASRVSKNRNQWSRRYPTSSVSYFSSLRTDLLKQHTTITQGWSYIISSMPNWASPALFPSDNGGWYNPSKRIMTPILMTSAVSRSEATESASTTQPPPTTNTGSA